MTSEELKIAIVLELHAREIHSSRNISNANVDQLLVEPEIIELVNVMGERKKYWLVLDEDPGDLEKGYRIVYAEKDDMFGLATKATIDDKDVGFLIGLYGSFVDALDSM
mgnify:CR=1 FL=1